MINYDYDSISLCHLADIFLAMQAGAKELGAIIKNDQNNFIPLTLHESHH